MTDDRILNPENLPWAVLIKARMRSYRHALVFWRLPYNFQIGVEVRTSAWTSFTGSLLIPRQYRDRLKRAFRH